VSVLRTRSKGQSSVRVCIHHGTKQIGGTCVEIEAPGSRIIVDLGLPLGALEANPGLIPQISGLRDHDPSLLAIVISHGHRDRWGLIPKVRPDIPIVMGRATERIMRAAADFVPDAFAPKASASSYAIMRRARLYRGENSEPGKDDRGEP
jgi:ribonuclease J